MELHRAEKVAGSAGSERGKRWCLYQRGTASKSALFRVLQPPPSPNAHLKPSVGILSRLLNPSNLNPLNLYPSNHLTESLTTEDEGSS